MKIGDVMQSVIFVGLITYASLIGGLYFMQRSLLYHPNQMIPQPIDYGVPEVAEVQITGSADVELHAWWHAPKDQKPTLVYFHGNAGHIGDRAHKVKSLLSDGYGILLMSYRYNANAQGSPSEAALIADGAAALKWLNNKSIATNDILLYGESLGSGIAVALAAQNEVKGLILEAPYSSVADVAQSAYWFVPAYWLVQDKFNSSARIGQVKAPILIVHGKKDRIIPIRFGQKLHAAAPENIKFVTLEQAGHADLYDHGMGNVVIEFLESLD